MNTKTKTAVAVTQEVPELETSMTEVILQEIVSGELVTAEQIRLSEITNELLQCDSTIEATYQKMGELLIEVREKELFKPQFASFGDYLDSIKLARATAYNHMDAMDVATRLKLQTPDIPLPSQAVLLKLAEVKEHPAFILFWRGCYSAGFTTADKVTDAKNKLLKMMPVVKLKIEKDVRLSFHIADSRHLDLMKFYSYNEGIGQYLRQAEYKNGKARAAIREPDQAADAMRLLAKYMSENKLPFKCRCE